LRITALCYYSNTTARTMPSTYYCIADKRLHAVLLHYYAHIWTVCCLCISLQTDELAYHRTTDYTLYRCIITHAYERVCIFVLSHRLLSSHITVQLSCMHIRLFMFYPFVSQTDESLHAAQSTTQYSTIMLLCCLALDK
jgi:hypothetical protein